MTAPTRRSLTSTVDFSQLFQAKEHLELALDAGKSGTWAWDMVRNVTEVSPSYRQLFALPSDTPVTYDVWLSRVHPADRERCERYGSTFFQGSESD
jgi:PAS domain-containing protein